MDRIDMHVHTTCSDGTMSPRDVVSLAKMLGLKAVAITDTDTMAAIPEAGETAALMGISVVPGIELSADFQGRTVQVLGYFLDPEARKLKDYQAWVRESRSRRLESVLEKLRRKGFALDLRQSEAEGPDASGDLQQIAKVLKDLGAVSSEKEAYRRYLDKGRSCEVPPERISLEDSAQLIRDCGGVAVLAHPLGYGFTRSELDALAKAAAGAKFSGMEILYSGCTQGDINKLYDLAEKYLLLPTGGSGFRGDNSPGVQLGKPDVPAYMLLMLAQSQWQ